MAKIRLLIFLLIFIPLTCQAGDTGLVKQLKKYTTQKVIRIVDGDTIILKDQTRVRLVGIQAPKLPLGRKNFKEWPMAKNSKKFLSDLILNKYVTLYFGGQRKDRYDRALAHIFRKDGLWVQGEMLRNGLARVYSFPDNRAVIPEMLAKEKNARENKRGIWTLEFYQPKDHLEAHHNKHSFQIITGTVHNVAHVRGTYYINFGDDWREDFTIVIKARVARKFFKAGVPIDTYQDKKIEVRGWLKSFNGPMIEATHPEQIVIVE